MGLIEKEYSLEQLHTNEIIKFTNSENIIIKFVPHQFDPLNKVGVEATSSFPNSCYENVQCVCTSKDTSLQFYDFILNTFKKYQTKTIWINPSKMPISCFLSSVIAWKTFSDSIKDNTHLGIFLPHSIIPGSNDEIDIWQSTMMGLNRGISLDKNAIWYMCLSRKPDEINRYISKFKPLEIFPITEVMNDVKNNDEIGIIDHYRFLEENKVRTENIMYINYKTPNETFKYILNSIQSLPRNPVIQQSVITPGGHPRSYMAIVLAATLMTSKMLFQANETFSNEISNELFILRSE